MRISLLIVGLLIGTVTVAAQTSGTQINGVIQTQAVTPGDMMNPPFTGTVDINVHAPTTLNASTGLMVVCHGLGGNYHQYDTECSSWVDDFNVYTVQINFRHSGVTLGSDFGKFQAIDVLRAVKYMFDNYPVNQQRVFLWGASAGGLVALNAARMAPRAFAFVAALAPVTRPTNENDRTQNGYEADPGGGWERSILGNNNFYTIEEHDIRDAQYGAKFLAPTSVFLFHGDADGVVDIQHSQDMQLACVANSVTSTLTVIANGDHNFAGAAQDENSRFLVTKKYLTTPFATITRSGPSNLDEQAKVTFPTRGTLAWPAKFDGQGLGTMASIPTPGAVVNVTLGLNSLQIGQSLPLTFSIANWHGASMPLNMLAALVHLPTGSVYSLLNATPFTLPTGGVGGPQSVPMVGGLPTGDFLIVVVVYGATPGPFLDLDYAQFTLTP